MSDDDLIVNFGSDAAASGNAGGGDEGGKGATAPAASGDNDVETRLEKLTRVLDSVVSNNQRQEAERTRSERQQLEQRIEQELSQSRLKVETAEKALADAYDSGEGVAIAKAQRELSEAAAKAERVDAEMTSARRQLEAADKEPKQARQLDTTNLERWKSKHGAWYGVDAEMTKAAHEIDRHIRAAGVLAAGSQEYFAAIDRQLASKFPDRLQGSPGGVAQSGSGGQRQENTGQRRIHASIADGMRKMGIDIDNPEVAKRYLENRQKLVEKGILPAEPVSGRIRA